MFPTKSCPVVTRSASGVLEVLVFRHPLAGVQLVKGSIEKNETPRAAALRELWEEAGIADARILRELGVWDTGFEGQVWALFLVAPNQALRTQWTHCTSDDGGQEFSFFWHDLASPPPNDCHPLFANAMAKISEALAVDRRTVA